MGRHHRDSLLDDVFDTLKLTPVWVGPALAAVTFVVLRYLVPLLFPVQRDGGVNAGSVIRPFLPWFAILFTAVVIVAWIAAEIHKLSNRRLLDAQTGASSVRDLPWQEFERLVCEAYRRRGYVAEVVGHACGDGGVDIELSRPGERVVVQCKHWRAYKVGVKTVRELLGVVTSRRATKGIVVTSGRFSREAVRFAEANRQVELVDGERLAQLVGEVQAGQPATSRPPSAMTADVAGRGSPACPTCGRAMVRRTARRGQRSGTQFWGCSRFPQCRGTRPL